MLPVLDRRRRRPASDARTPSPASSPMVALVLLLLLHCLVAAAADGGSSLISPLTRFDSKGQLPQSDAAARAVAKGGPVVAIAARDAVVLVAPCKPPIAAPAGRLVEGAGLPKMWRLGARACLSHAGLSQDSRALLLAAQQAALDHEQRFGEGEMSLGEVVEAVASKQQEATMQGTKRPYGASILVAGMVRANGGGGGAGGGKRGGGFVPRIYRSDPSGAYSLWKACALGQGSDKAMALLEEKYRPGLTTREALALALDCCRALASPAPHPAASSSEAAEDKEGGADKEKEKEKEGEAAAAAAAGGGAEAVDVAIVSAAGTRLWDRRAVEAVVGLVAEEEEDDRGPPSPSS